MGYHVISPKDLSVMNHRVTDHRASWMTVLEAVFLVMEARLLPKTHIIEYVFVIYRYAGNILAGKGSHYNPVKGFSDPLIPIHAKLLTDPVIST